MAGRMGQGSLVRSIGTLFEHGPVSGLDDGDLLDRFVGRRDEAAFSALVTLHGPAVLGVCRRILHNPHDVEDAFQATFLVLVRRAGSIRDPHRLAPWLHGVARRVALRARADAARRQAQVSRMESVASNLHIEPEYAEVRGAIDEEVGRLPARYRDAVILCDLEGRSYAEAARRLRCPLGTVQSRLARGRQKLRIGLTRRGLAPVAGGMAVADLIGESASAAVSISLREATVQAAIATALGRSAMAGAVSATAAALMTGALRGMAVASLKTASTAVVLVASILLGGGLLARGISADSPAPAVAEVQKPKPPIAAKKATAEKAVPGGFSLGGIVLRPGGRPAPGATVIIERPDNQQKVVRLATDRGGRFQSGPVFDPHRSEAIVTAIAPGLAWTESLIRVGPSMPPMTIRLTPRQPLHGHVIDSKGKPVKGAVITPITELAGGQFDWDAETDADGRFEWFEAPTSGTIRLNATRAPFAQATRQFEGVASREITITLHRPLHLHGTVTDAVTGKPIERFSLISGWGPDEHGDQVEWLRNSASSLGGGRFDLNGPFPDQGFRRSIRIEADGYLPGDLIGFRDDAEDVAHDFKLRPAKPLTGIVRGSDGKPLAGADVALSAEEERAQIKNGQLIRYLVVGGGTMTKTDADGRYTFKPQAGKVGIVVVHDSGFGYSPPDALAKSTDITVARWGRIEGTLRIGSKPAAGQKVAAWLINPWIYNRVDYDTTTDDQGRFVIERVVPYRVGVYRYVDIAEGNGWIPSNQVNVNVPPGETVRVDIGGTGRPVVGRLKVPAGVSLADFVLGFGSLAVERARMPYPDDYPDFTDQQRSDWHTAFGKTPAGRAFAEGDRMYAVALRPDGTFRIEDVPAGRYVLKLPFKDRTGREERRPNRLAFARAEVVVPEILGGRSDEPFNIGAIPLAVFPFNTLSVGEPVPEIPTKGADGRILDIKAYRGKFVLLAFWSTQSRTFLGNIPALKATHDAFGRDPRLIMIGLNRSADPEFAKRYAARHGLTWEQRYLGVEEAEPISAALGSRLPTQAILIGPDGRLIAKDLHGDAIKQAVADALKPKG